MLLIALERYLDGSAGWLWVALAACLLGPLVKVPGIALAGAAATILALRGRRSGALACVLAGALGLAAFAAYGLALDWSTFLAVQREQAGRLLGPSGAFDFFVGPSYYALPIDGQHVVQDGFWILGLVGLGAMLFQPDRRPAELVVWPVVAYASTILLLGSGHVFTYYHLAVYPMAYLAAGRLALQALKDLSVPGLGLVLGLAAATIRVPGLPAPALPWLVGALILAVVAAAAMAVWRDSRTTATARRMVAWGALGIVVGGNLAASATLASGTM